MASDYNKEKAISEIRKAGNGGALFFPCTPGTIRAFIFGGNPKQRREWTQAQLKQIKHARYTGNGWFELVDYIEPEPEEKPIRKTRIAKTKKKKVD